MAYWKARPDVADIYTLQEIERVLDDLQDETNRVRSSISFQLRCREQIDANLRRSVSRIQRERNDAQRMASGLSRSMELYQKAEQDAAGQYNGSGGQVPSGADSGGGAPKFPSFGAIDWPPFTTFTDVSWLPFVGSLLFPGLPAVVQAVTKNLPPEWPSGSASVWGGSVGTEGSFLGAHTSGTADWSALGVEGKMNGFADWDLDKGMAGAGVKGEVEGYLGKVETEGEWGWLSGGAALAVGTAAVSGEAGAYLFRDGKLDPSLRLKAGAEVKGISGEAKAQFGSDDYNVHISGEGSVGYANAEAGCALGRDGISAKAEVGAAAVKGEVQGGFTLFGIKIDVAAEGSALSVGAGAEFNATSNSFELGGKLAFLAGLGLKIKVSW